MAEENQGYRNVSEEDQRKAKVFFDRARTVASTGQYDFAIMMYLEGLNIDPDCVEAHQELREVGLKRKASGGGSLGMFERAKVKTNTKDDKLNMLGHERLLSFDPGETDYMIGLMQNAHRGGYVATVMWIGPELLRANAQSKKPDKKKFIILKDIYKDLKQWTQAIEACSAAKQVDPGDMDLMAEIKNLSALETMRKGYDTATSFKDVVKDKDGQQRLMESQKDVLTEDVLVRHIRDAEAEFKVNPNEPGKINKLAEALLRTEDFENENRAIEVLDDAFKRLKRFQFRQRLGQAKMDQMKRMERSLRQALIETPDDEALRQDYEQYVKEQREFELAEYTLWAEQYPTDLTLKYEMAARLFALRRFDEAIPLFQQSRLDPKKKNDATIALGRCFLEAGFADEAIETLQQVIDEYANTGDDRSKLMYYWQGRAFEAKGVFDQAINRYSRVAQWEFKYRDVQQRVKDLRSKHKGEGK
ncbi:MAG: tetratricopeptide repeat protein [Tepidisphaerales bacterium]